MSSRLMACNVFRNAVEIARKMSNGLEILVLFFAAAKFPD
jgi:hypothetical protein